MGQVRGEITRILERLDGAQPGDDGALQRLFEVAYAELRRLAESCLRNERESPTLQPTVLVHDVFLRLAEDRPIAWQSRAHFFGVAARAMRQILVEHARRKKAEIHGGGVTRMQLDESIEAPWFDAIEVLALEEALNDLGRKNPRLVQVVEFRVFSGMNVAAIAHVLGVSERTVHQDWSFARLWLAERLGQDRKK